MILKVFQSNTKSAQIQCNLNKLYGTKQTKNSFLKYGDCDRKRCSSNFVRKLLFLLVKSIWRDFLIESRNKKKKNSQKYKFFSNIRHCFNELIITFQSALYMHFQAYGFQKAMQVARKVKIAEELENFVKDFGYCTLFILNSNTFTCFFLSYSLPRKIET